MPHLVQADLKPDSAIRPQFSPKQAKTDSQIETNRPSLALLGQTDQAQSEQAAAPHDLQPRSRLFPLAGRRAGGALGRVVLPSRQSFFLDAQPHPVPQDSSNPRFPIGARVVAL